MMSKGHFLRTAPFVVLGVVLFLLPLRLWAGDLIESRAYFKDPTGKLTFNEIRDLPFTPYTGILTAGFTQSVYWIRLRIDPALADSRSAVVPAGGFPPAIHDQSDRSDEWVLRVRPPFLDRIELFDPLEPDRLRRVTGNITPWLDSEFRSLNHAFVIPRSNEPRDVWLRVSATSTMLVGVDVLTYDAMRAIEKRQEILNALDLALALFFIIWAAFLFAVRSDRLVGAFLLVAVASFFYASNYVGYYRIFLGELFSAAWLDSAHSFLLMLILAAYMLFNRRILADYSPRPWMMRVLLPVQYYFVLGGLLLLSGYETVALSINTVIAIFGQAWICLILLCGLESTDQRVQRQPLLPRAWVLTYSLVLLFLFGGLALPALGWIEATQTSLYRSIIQGTVPFSLMAAIVHLRNRRLEKEQQLQVARAEQAAAAEKRRREESEQFLAMLTHEIRTPLTVMAYAAKTDLPDGQLGEHVKSGIREIDELIERCVQADRVDQASLQVVMSKTTVQAVFHSSRARFAEDRVQWQIEPPLGALISTDITLFEVVLNNLIDNALKYAPADATVKVDVLFSNNNTKQGLLVRVSNPPGPAGFPDPTRLFQKYYRAPRAHIKTGSGLGLYVARSFARRLGGQLDYHRTNGLVLFELWLPI